MGSTSYDPLVVDTFINVFAKIAPAAIKAGQEARSLVTAGTFEDLTSDPGESLRQIRASASETAVLGACDHAILASNSAAEALSAAGQSLRELTPATVLALYTYDTGKDALVCTSTLGDTLKLLDQLTISLGERVTGWCGANLTTVLNSDASLDLEGIGAFFVPPLRSAICTPLVKGDRLLGVLTGYSPKVEAFAEQHQYTFEHVTAVLSVAIERHRNSNVTPFRRLEA